MFARIIALSLLISVHAYGADCARVVNSIAEDVPTDSNHMSIECPNQLIVTDLCMAVSEGLAYQDMALGTRHSYQHKILKASGVEPGDDAETRKLKVQDFWNSYQGELLCKQLGFSVTNGHILKLAVERNNQNFLEEVTLDWGLDLNHVDEVDQKTVLDYIQSELVAARGTSREGMLVNSFELLRENGAKYKSEL